MLELWQERTRGEKMLESAKRKASGKLQPLGGKGQPRERGPMTAQARMCVLTVPTLSVSSSNSYCVQGTIASIPLCLLVDTGAAVSLLSADAWNKVSSTEHPIVLQQWTRQRLVGVNGTPLCVKGCIHTSVSIRGTQFEAKFVVSSDLWVDGIILGLDFIEQHDCVIDIVKKVLNFRSQNLLVGLQHTGKVQECQTARLTVGLITTQKVLVPPESEMEIMVRASDGGNTVEGEWIVESNPSMSHGVAVARAIVCPKNGLIPLRILNPRNCNIPLKKGTELARMERIEGPVVNLSAVRGTDTGKVSTAAQETLWSLASKVGDHISAVEKEHLFTLLYVSMRTCFHLAAPTWAERPFFDITLIQVTKPLFISLHDACPKHEEKKCVAFCEKCWKVESSNLQTDHGLPQSFSHRKRMGPSASAWITGE